MSGTWPGHTQHLTIFKPDCLTGEASWEKKGGFYVRKTELLGRRSTQPRVDDSFWAVPAARDVIPYEAERASQSRPLPVPARGVPELDIPVLEEHAECSVGSLSSFSFAPDRVMGTGDSDERERERPRWTGGDIPGRGVGWLTTFVLPSTNSSRCPVTPLASVPALCRHSDHVSHTGHAAGRFPDNKTPLFPNVLLVHSPGERESPLSESPVSLCEAHQRGIGGQES